MDLKKIQDWLASRFFVPQLGPCHYVDLLALQGASLQSSVWIVRTVYMYAYFYMYPLFNGNQ